ncbi:hypothetical protein O3M35_000218 [Rhynocoris fuscipes]|uniref:Daxx histone-binding domain-containing protein n=1 Tax=Rhynocoris fuscipes TaxID=488301 RepID=A0AAW1DKX2_9HEMI
MECITISSDEDDLEILSMKSAKPNNNCNNNTSKQVNTSKVKHEPSQKVGSLSCMNGTNPAIQKIPLITLVDDNEENSCEDIKPFPASIGLVHKNSVVTPRKTESVPSQNDLDKIQNGYKVDGEKQKKKLLLKGSDIKHKKLSLSKEAEKKKDHPGGLVSNDDLIQKLLDSCRKVNYGDQMEIVERKIWNYFRSASESKTKSYEFRKYLEDAITKIEEILNSTRDTFLISRVVRDCINEMKNDPNVVNDKLRQLYSFYEKLVKRISKLEEVDVESDDDGENPYILLDKYRKKAVAAYNKICELEGRSADADRPTLQRFFFNSSTAPVPVQRALEKFYNKTHNFPDFYDVRKLVKKVNKEENLNLSDNDIYKIAQSVFIEFGERLIHRRKYDDYNILVDYLKNGQIADPADLDTELLMKLEQNKKIRKSEQEVLDRYAMQDAINVKKKDEDSASESKTKENSEIKTSVEISTISVSSSSSDSSISSSPAQSDNEEDCDDDEEGDDENSKQGLKKNQSLFSDSEEELVIDLDDKRKRLDVNDATSKRLKTDNVTSSEPNNAP